VKLARLLHTPCIIVDFGGERGARVAWRQEELHAGGGSKDARLTAARDGAWPAGEGSQQALGDKVSLVVRGSVVRDARDACGGFGQTKTNDVSLDVGWKMIYRMIQWLDRDAQLAGWLAHYFAYIYTYTHIYTHIHTCTYMHT
jgi:hypothetical protein